MGDSQDASDREVSKVGPAPSGLVVFGAQQGGQLMSLTPQSASLLKIKTKVFVSIFLFPADLALKPLGGLSMVVAGPAAGVGSCGDPKPVFGT